MKVLFRHIGIVTQNVEESIKFYEVLGFNLVKECIENPDFISRISNYGGTCVTTYKMTSDNGDMIELLDYSGDGIHCSSLIHEGLEKYRTLFDRGIAHFALTVENMYEIYHILTALENVKFKSSPQMSPDGAAMVVFCIAPEGTFIELVEELSK